MSKKINFKTAFSQMTTKATDDDLLEFESFPEEVKSYGRLPPQMIKAVVTNGITLDLIKTYGHPDLPKLKRGQLEQLRRLYAAMEAGFLKRDQKVVDFYEETLKGRQMAQAQKVRSHIRRRLVNDSPSLTPPAADSPLEPSTPGNLFNFGEQTMSCERTFRSMQSEDLERQSSDSSQGSVTKWPSQHTKPSEEFSPLSPIKDYDNYCEECKDDCVLSPDICYR